MCFTTFIVYNTKKNKINIFAIYTTSSFLSKNSFVSRL